ncbi:FadR/GntR family transcriptional regulator [Nocardioides daeguensis]|uniref:FadR/GntR family transcriptional regulator n=1 Tax=Nocardioides daeguensis TaxID=908359 RepID=A0ABP6UYJ1_9ACTN|nr:FadR/GntR family transcriptional regulator [Nocardioides daeguensis]MBV6727113.1 FadR family transcriptional regulator [Nocardioides daeguensis]MCR1771484.1 FadR family transcriptional regulator [Nocardioides daeguensis]
MPLVPTTPASLVDQAIAGMRALLESGEWEVGTRIPPEPALASALGVSRNTVREAVKALAHLGLLQVRRGDGTYVAAMTDMQALMRKQLDRVDIAHLLEVRHAIEVRAAALAAERRTAADLAELDAIMTRRREALGAGDGPAFVDADVAFHCAVVAAAHNPLLVELYDGLVGTLRASIELPDDADLLAAEHDAVLAAVRAGDPALAASATGDLLDHVVR